MFWNMLSPENALENILPRPPPEVAICMFGVIHTMDPFSVTMDSPSARLQVTTGNDPPIMLYCMTVLSWWADRKAPAGDAEKHRYL